MESSRLSSPERTSIGLDARPQRVACAIDTVTRGLIRRRLTPEHADILGWITVLPGPAAVAYEAGPTGFALARTLSSAGVRCEVLAPSKLQRPAGERVKTDARDALHLARLLRIDEFTAVRVPSVAEEHARDLVLSRESVREELMRARHWVSKLLLRQGPVYCGSGGNWRPAHHAWLQLPRFDDVAQQAAYDSAYEAVVLAEARRARLERSSDRAIGRWRRWRRTRRGRGPWPGSGAHRALQRVCGNHPAHISMDHASNTDTHAARHRPAPSTTPRPRPSRGRHPTRPLDRTTYISVPNDLTRLRLVVTRGILTRWYGDPAGPPLGAAAADARPRRPPINHRIRTLVPRLVKENSSWRYWRVHGALPTGALLTTDFVVIDSLDGQGRRPDSDRARERACACARCHRASRRRLGGAVGAKPCASPCAHRG